MTLVMDLRPPPIAERLMAIKTILVCLTNEETSDSLMRAACILARTHTAHLIGLHTIEAMTVYPGIAVHIPSTVFEQFNASQLEQADKIKAIFERHTAKEDFVAEWRLQHTKSTKASERIIDSARIADLVLVPNENPELERSDQHHLQEEVINECGRPVLMVPADFDAESIGTHVLVGWNDTREAARAAHDALDILQEGARAHLLRVHGEDDDLTYDATLTELAQTYARHNIDTSIGHRAWQRHQVAEIIELEAFERGCDLIAVGAFSHSRAYAVIHGAATRDLLRGAKRPVLFSR
jgi:nucleotide-binding universal stress UspA family protein